MRTHAWFTVLALAVCACGGKAKAKQQNATSNELTTCEADAQCQGETCICGYCTSPCESDADCGAWPDSSCRPGTAIGCSREGALCLPKDAENPSPGDGPNSGQNGEPEPGLIPEDDDLPRPEPEPEPEPANPRVDTEECRALASSDAGLASGSALVDRYFAAVEHTAARTRALARETIALFAELAQQVGADPTAASVVESYPAWASELVGSRPTLLMWSAHCPIATSELDAKTVACDPELAPGDEGLDCDGVCLPAEGANCSDGTLECRVASPDTCGGACEGACETPLGAGGWCEGGCTGTCTVLGADACEDGQTACRSETGAPALCAGACEGELTPRETIAGCSEVARAAAWLGLTCTATAPVVFDAGSADAGATASAPELNEFLETSARVFAIQDEATLTLKAAALLNAALPSVEAALPADQGDAGASSACAPALLSLAATTLGEAGAELDQVMRDASAFIVGIQ